MCSYVSIPFPMFSTERVAKALSEIANEQNMDPFVVGCFLCFIITEVKIKCNYVPITSIVQPAKQCKAAAKMVQMISCSSIDRSYAFVIMELQTADNGFDHAMKRFNHY